MIKCLIACTNELMGVALENLFKTQADLEVLKLAPFSGANLAHEMERYRPDVLILDDYFDLNSPAGLLVSSMNFPELRIIMLDKQLNLLQVYKKQDVLVTQSSDLLSVVRNEAH